MASQRGAFRRNVTFDTRRSSSGPLSTSSWLGAACGISLGTEVCGNGATSFGLLSITTSEDKGADGVDAEAHEGGWAQLPSGGRRMPSSKRSTPRPLTKLGHEGEVKLSSSIYLQQTSVFHQGAGMFPTSKQRDKRVSMRLEKLSYRLHPVKGIGSSSPEDHRASCTPKCNTVHS